jgi:F-type H+-transporting ATPase subunit epsilon
MADKINFELVSPERLLMSTTADMVQVPGAEGDFGVMAGHTPVVSTLRPGLVEVQDGSDVTKLFVRGGLAEVSQTNLTILAEEAIPLEDLKLSDLDQRLKDLEEDISDARTDEVRAAAQLAHGQLKQVRDTVANA